MANIGILPPLYGLRVRELIPLFSSDSLVLTGAVPYERGTLLNRMQILGANGLITLSIPVKKHKKGTPVSGIRIDYLQKWQNQHWRSIASAYGKSPFFQYFKSELEDLFQRQPDLLMDFTSALCLWIFNQYMPEKPKSAILTHEPNGLQPIDGFLLSSEQDSGLGRENIRYQQVFGEDFVPGLSILDHLFCEGTKFWNLQN